MPDLIFKCPHCGYDISNMTHKDAIRKEETRTIYGKVNIFKCPNCSDEFSDLTIDIDRR